MNRSQEPTETGLRREAMIIAALTLAGGLLRIWAFGRLGLVHFDEGVYAITGTWALSPRGIAAIDPMVISYAPPGFPILVGLAYSVLGVGDLPAILVSILAGTLTIPVAGWLGYRTFGRGAGALASTFATFSGPHIAFSRMALTDSSFLLAWLVAIGLGQRFVERPTRWRALAFGIAVGAAQLFKYNGWLAGAIVAATVGLWTAIHRDDREVRSPRALWGWGIAAAVVAAFVYWPWFQFVQANGGYSALLTHQRGYLGGWSAWLPHAVVQFGQERAMSGGFGWRLLTGVVCALALLTTAKNRGRILPARVLAVLGLPAICMLMPGDGFYALLACGDLCRRIRTVSPAATVVAVGWLTMALLTPFYHPYARLALPWQGLSWILMTGAMLGGRALCEDVAETDARSIRGVSPRLLLLIAVVWIAPLGLAWFTPFWNPARGIGLVLGPSDSLRTACRTMAEDLKDLRSPIRILARPPMRFYLAGAVPMAPRGSERELFDIRDTRALALLDSAMTGQGSQSHDRPRPLPEGWEVVREYASTMNLPTLFDVEPAAAFDPSMNRSAPLWLLRRKAAGTPR